MLSANCDGTLNHRGNYLERWTATVESWGQGYKCNELHVFTGTRVFLFFELVKIFFLARGYIDYYYAASNTLKDSN